MKNVKVPLAPYVLLSVLIVYGIGGTLWIWKKHNCLFAVRTQKLGIHDS